MRRAVDAHHGSTKLTLSLEVRLVGSNRHEDERSNSLREQCVNDNRLASRGVVRRREEHRETASGELSLDARGDVEVEGVGDVSDHESNGARYAAVTKVASEVVWSKAEALRGAHHARASGF